MTGNYTWTLIVLSYIVAMMASHVALDLAGRVTATRGSTAFYWLGAGAVAMGVGVWSMHSIGMLAFHLPIPMAYDRWMTMGSMLIAVVVSGFALYTVGRRTLTWMRLAAAGVAMGLGISAMHYTGMAAMQITPGIRYDLRVVVASIFIAIAASCAALRLAFELRSGGVAYAAWKKLASAAVMGAAIVGMHFTGMAAAHFAAGTICTVPSDHVDSLWLAGTIAGFATLLLAAMMLISIIDARLVRRIEAAYMTISELAQKDPLTGLANRRAFLERLSLAFATARRGTEQFALLMIDLDHFKDANDTLGHPVGDELLRAVAARLSAAVRQSDLVARLGGDEFAVLQIGVDDVADAASQASRIGAAVGAPYRIGNNDLRVTASIGISLSQGGPGDCEAIMKQADLALYNAKDEGRNCFRLHDAHLDRNVHERVTLADELAAGIERGELILVYQPQVELPSGRVIGLEALVRWNHPSRGLLMPGVFIPIAERSGSIAALGAWVVEEACQQLSRWRSEGLDPGLIAINVSGLQFNGPGDFVQIVADSLERWSISPSQIELELTETVLIEATQKHADTFERLRRLGVGLAIDDFGTGYSSLNYLANYPVTRLKIAQQLVAGVTADRRSAAVVRAAIALAHELGIECIAEGVETAALANFLFDADCEQAQGYHFSPPISAELIADLLHRRDRSPPSLVEPVAGAPVVGSRDVVVAFRRTG